MKIDNVITTASSLQTPFNTSIHRKQHREHATDTGIKSSFSEVTHEQFAYNDVGEVTGKEIFDKNQMQTTGKNTWGKNKKTASDWELETSQKLAA